MENITVGGLFGILDKRIVINVFEAGNNELLFDSSKWNGKNYLKRKRWDDIKNRNVLQLSVDEISSEAQIYIEPLEEE